LSFFFSFLGEQKFYSMFDRLIGGRKMMYSCLIPSNDRTQTALSHTFAGNRTGHQSCTPKWTKIS
jgi:hypothetical protein